MAKGKVLVPASRVDLVWGGRLKAPPPTLLEWLVPKRWYPSTLVRMLAKFEINFRIMAYAILYEITRPFVIEMSQS